MSMSQKRMCRKHARRGALALAAAATATAMSLGPITPAPDAGRDVVDLYTSGLIFEVLPPIPLLENLPADPAVISQTLIADAVPVFGTHTIFGFMDGAYAAGQAIPAVNAASYPDRRQQLQLRADQESRPVQRRAVCPLRSAVHLLGQGTRSAAMSSRTQTGSSARHLRSIYAPTKSDVTWAYDFYSDFPIAPNPFSIANSLAAGIFVTNLLGPTHPNVTLRQPQHLHHGRAGLTWQCWSRCGCRAGSWGWPASTCPSPTRLTRLPMRCSRPW